MKFRTGIFPGLVAILIISACQDQEKKTGREEVAVESSAPQTYAELSVKQGGAWKDRKYEGGKFVNVQEAALPEAHTYQSGYIRYEGPGWENSRVAYRLYLDWRNTIDIFGKKTDTMVLARVGQESSPSYHEEAPWGMDILKAGESLGLGGFGRYNGKQVLHFEKVGKTVVRVENSEDSSVVEIQYGDWKTGEEEIDLEAQFSIYPHGRFTRVSLDPSTAIENLVTGIVRSEGIELLTRQNENGQWAYMATYGEQTLVNEEDKLGMAIFYKTTEAEEIVSGPHDHLLVFKPSEDPVTYYFLAAWEQEKNGIRSKEEFLAELEEKLILLGKQGSLHKLQN